MSFKNKGILGSRNRVVDLSRKIAKLNKEGKILEKDIGLQGRARVRNLSTIGVSSIVPPILYKEYRDRKKK